MKNGDVMNMNSRYKSESMICKERGSRFQARGLRKRALTTWGLECA